MTDDALHSAFFWFSVGGVVTWLAWIIIPPVVDAAWATFMFWWHTRKNQ